MTIKILGTGCPNCKRLEANTKKAVENLEVDAVVEKVEDIPSIMKYGVMSTPALVIDDIVQFMGRVASSDEIAGLIKSQIPGLTP
ncbi:MAG TPA: thioredoxin family protein [Balneolales bacterium]|nr:thioredoxin family protein [Balneolales bacterium]